MKIVVACAVLSVILVLFVSARSGRAAPASSAPAVLARAQGESFILSNGLVEVGYDGRGQTISARCLVGAAKAAFIKKGALGESPEPGAEARLADANGALGAGKCVQVTWPSGRGVAIALYPGLPMVCVTASMRNAGPKDITIAKMVPLVAEVDVGVPADKAVAFGAEGPYKAATDRGNYAFLAVAQPRTRCGVVCGWLTHLRASGIVMLRGKDSPVAIEARGEYGRLLIKPGETAQGETFGIGWFDDCLDGLETYAAAVARAHQIKLRPQVPGGYCTWYHAGALDEKRMAALAQWADKNLKPYGFDVLQIDDGWQIAGRDFTAYNPKGRYPSGMKATAEAIRSHGFMAGIWLIPFGWDHTRSIFKDHQDYFAKHKDGSVYQVHWAGTCLDCTNPQARKFLSDCVSRITKDWKYNYLKIDGLWTGMAVKILYPSPRYRQDDLGGAVLHDPTKTQIEAYRMGLKLVREAAGKDVFILGCNIAQNMRTLGGSIGLLDGMRIGPDVGASWGGVTRCAQPTSYLYFLHHHVWFSDPDCLMLRSPLTVDQGRAWGTLIAISGQMNLVSEWLPGLDDARVETIRRTNPNTGLLGRPVDLFDSTLPKVWQLRVGQGEGRRDIVGLFNWDADKPATIGVDLADLGLPAGEGDRYVGFDFWENQFLPPLSGKLSLACRGGSCRAVSLVRLLDRPQLVGSSRHVCQGVVDVKRLSWNASRKVLSGTSAVVANDPYELRISAPPEPQAWQAASAGVPDADKAAGVTIQFSQSGPWVRATIRSKQSRDVAWQVAFNTGSP